MSLYKMFYLHICLYETEVTVVEAADILNSEGETADLSYVTDFLYYETGVNNIRI